MPPSSPTEVKGVCDPTNQTKLSNGVESKEGPASTYPGIWRYPTNRDDRSRSPDDWMESKKKDDNIGDLWRVHNKLYDLTPFINVHPGGSEWIRLTRGTDITEAFVSSHMVNVKSVERMLEHYYVKQAALPRISPYTFKEDGFYMTLKRKVEPIFQKVGTGPTLGMLLFQDALVAGFVVFGVLASLWNSMALGVVSGLFLCFQTIGNHNFAHMRDTWRNYYFDLSLGSSHEWKITHCLSHHMYPNTLLDIQIQAIPTYEFMPNRPKTWMQRNFVLYYSHLMYAIGFWVDFYKRIKHVSTGRVPFRPENLIPFMELLVLMRVADDWMTGIYVWVIMHTVCSYVFITIGVTAGHHHKTCFCDGDEPMAEPDFGLCQLDATKDRAEDFFDQIFVTLVTFGHHPIHHLFPAVCHSKLDYVKDVFEQTCREFNVEFPGIPQKELYFSCYEELARIEPTKSEERAQLRKKYKGVKKNK